MKKISNEKTIMFLEQLMNIIRQYSDQELNKTTKRREEIAELVNSFVMKELDNDN